MKTKCKRPRRLQCCCCGKWTMGRQWWNRDDGFGLCHSCIDDCHAGDAAGVKLGDTHESYGVRGHHYDLESFAETMKLKTNET